MNSSPSQITLRLAGRADAEKITALINVAFRGAEQFFVDGDRIDLKSVLESQEIGEFLLIEDNGLLAGCVYLEQRGDRTYLGLLSVDPSRQQTGMGSLLMSAAEEHCRARNDRFIDILIVNLREACHFINMSKAL
jgi:N-acetylglutamate synthase-like GNAT family acetyltransferase